MFGFLGKLWPRAADVTPPLGQPVDTATGALAMLRAVTGGDVMRLPQVWRAVSLVADRLCVMEPRIYDRVDETAAAVSKTPAPVFVYANETMTWPEYVQHMIEQMLEHGQSVARIKTAQGVPTALTPLPPAERERTEAGAIVYHIGNERFQAREIVDLVWKRDRDGLTPREPKKILREAFESVGLGQFHTRRSLANGGLPLLAATISENATAEQMTRAASELMKHIRASLTSEARGSVVMFPAGIEVAPVGQNFQEFEFAEMQKFLTEQVARIYGVPAIYLDVNRPQTAQPESQQLRLLSDLHGYAVRFAGAHSMKLWPQGDTFLALDAAAILRASTKDLFDALGTAVQRGVLTPNEARQRCGLEPVTDEYADALFLQKQMVSAKAAYEGEGDDAGNPAPGI